MCSLLIHVRDNVLKDDDVKTRFDSVGGVNFQVLIVYLICIMVIGEIAIYWQILNREASIKERIKWFDVSLIGRIFVRLFPIHFLYLQMARAKIETMLLRRKIINTWIQSQNCLVSLFSSLYLATLLVISCSSTCTMFMNLMILILG